MNKNVVILEKGANPILNNLAKEISDASDFVVKTGSDDVISEIEQEEEFSDGGKINVVALGDSPHFQDRVSTIKNVISFCSAEISSRETSRRTASKFKKLCSVCPPLTYRLNDILRSHKKN